MSQLPPGAKTDRNVRWAATMSGYSGPVRLAHADSAARIDRPDAAGTGGSGAHLRRPLEREAREEREDGFLAPGATRAVGGGERANAEEADPWRTCFERDRDRILHAT